MARPGGARKVPATGGYGIEGVVDEAVGRRARRLRPAQQAVAVERVGVAAAREIEGSRLRPRERPLALVAPAILTHDEDAQRRWQPGVAKLTAQHVGGETQVHRVEVHGGLRPEVDFAGLRAAVAAMAPRTDDEPPGPLRSGGVPHAVGSGEAEKGGGEKGSYQPPAWSTGISSRSSAGVASPPPRFGEESPVEDFSDRRLRGPTRPRARTSRASADPPEQVAGRNRSDQRAAVAEQGDQLV